MTGNLKEAAIMKEPSVCTSNYQMFIVGCLALTVLAASLSRAAADTPDELFLKAKTALDKGQGEEALRLVNLILVAEPGSVRGLTLRAAAHGALDQHAEAIADYDKVIAAAPNTAEAYDRRGSEYFKIGEMQKAIADFDRFLRFHPEEEPGHWRRGIAYYYAGRYEAGRKQFEGYEKVDTNDVENAVWRFLCMARDVGVKKAQSDMMKIGQDRRVPMMVVYKLFQGQANPADVMAAVTEGKPTGLEARQRAFLAHLYLGLYYDVTDDKPLALEHISKAADAHKVAGYMGDVARVHVAILRKAR
jgi:lipoprotein NlpI